MLYIAFTSKKRYTVRIMNELTLNLTQNPIIYVTRDIERAIGFDLDTIGYYIISNKTSFAKQIVQGRENVLLIDENEQLDTWELLQHPKTKTFASKIKNPHILVFKNTSQIERTCKENNWVLLNPPAELSNRVEEKISQINWLGELSKYLPSHEIRQCKNVLFGNKPFILQFNRSHTGGGTMLIQSQTQLEEIQQKFPNREVRITEFISGFMFTNNNVVTKDNVLIGNINYQITGLSPFTQNKFATIGNDWGVVKKLLNETQIEEYKKMARDIGNKLRQDGWKGLFGIDVVCDKTNDKLHLIEINARQPASTTYESLLQNNYQIQENLTTFEAHLMALLDLKVKTDLVKITDGAQIILRNADEQNFDIQNIQVELQKEQFNTIQYDNTKLGTDLLRIQSKTSLIQMHNEFNERGKLLLQNLF